MGRAGLEAAGNAVVAALGNGNVLGAAVGTALSGSLYRLTDPIAASMANSLFPDDPDAQKTFAGVLTNGLASGEGALGGIIGGAISGQGDMSVNALSAADAASGVEQYNHDNDPFHLKSSLLNSESDWHYAQQEPANDEGASGLAVTTVKSVHAEGSVEKNLDPSNFQIRTNFATGKAAEAEVIDDLQKQGLEVVPSITFKDENGTRCVADCTIVNGQPNQNVNVPSGFVVEDLQGNRLLDFHGNPVSILTLDANGRLVVEIKTGKAELTRGQNLVYPKVAQGSATAVGEKRAGAAGINGKKTAVPVIVLRAP